jgi:uncharacterized membrane protein YfcA
VPVHPDYKMSIAGLIVGVVVGLTGMGGGALMTPILVLFFHTTPSAAVSSDLVTSLFMKPIGGAVHWRRATVHRQIVKWLLIPAVPSAFAGVFVLNALGGKSAEDRIKFILGVALVLAFVAMVLRLLMRRTEQVAGDDGLDTPVRRPRTILIGMLGGLVVGMTSVGSGSMIIVALMWLYPRLSNRALVGTDLVQAVPLVGAAALGHVLFGDVNVGVTAWLLVGSLPGVFVGAQISSRTTAPWLRPVLAAVLLASAMKLLNAPSLLTGGISVAVALLLLFVLPWILPQRGAPKPAPALATEENSHRAHLG